MMYEGNSPPWQNEREGLSKERYTDPTPEFILPPTNEAIQLARVYPIRGEWQNGHLVSLLKNLATQHLDGPVEILFVVNMGDKLMDIVERDSSWRYAKDDVGNFKLKPIDESVEAIEPGSPEAIWLDTQKSATFLKRIVELQQSDQPDQLLAELSIQYPEHKQLFEQLVINPNLRFGVINATTWKSPKDYSGEQPGPAMATMRTLGLDVLDIRYGKIRPDLPVVLGDVDTIDDGDLLQKTSSLFANNELLEQFTIPLTYKPGLEDPLQFVTSPETSLKRAIQYTHSHGSPQIVARLVTLQRLDEIGDYSNQLGFAGGEDIDTSDRLIFYFGQMMRAYGFKHGLTIRPPIVLTTSRSDGFTDGNIDQRQLAFRLANVDTTGENVDYNELERILSEFKQKRANLDPIPTPLDESLKRYAGKRRKMAESVKNDSRADHIEAVYQHVRSVMDRRVRGMQRVNSIVCELLLECNKSGLLEILTDNENMTDTDRQNIQTFLENTELKATRAILPGIRQKAIEQVISMMQYNRNILLYMSRHPELLSWLEDYLMWLKTDSNKPMPTLSTLENIQAIQETIIQYTGRISKKNHSPLDTASVNNSFEEGDSVYLTLMSDVLSLGVVDTLFFAHQELKAIRSSKENTFYDTSDRWPARIEDQLTAKNEYGPLVKRSLAPRSSRLSWLAKTM
jgi:hypothetical protein